jgi:8-oxo-dGTP diphosphatase
MARDVQKDGRVHGVVVACARADEKWLCIRRSAAVPAPLKVCFPGGAIEAGESILEAAIREMNEELGIIVRPRRCVWRWESPASALTLWGWTAGFDEQTIRPDPSEVAEVMWLSAADAAGHPDAMPSMAGCVAALERDEAIEAILP